MTSRTAGDHCQNASAAKPTASSGTAHSLRMIGRPHSAHSTTGPPNRAPSRTALPPIGVSISSATVAPIPYSAAPQRSARCSRGSTIRQASANGRDRQVGR